MLVGHRLIGAMWEKFRDPKYAFEAHLSSYDTHTYNPHSHDYPQLFYCLSGKYIHTVGDVEYECSEGSIIIVPIGVSHGYRSVDDNGFVHIQLNVLLNFFDDFTDENQLRTIVHLFLNGFEKELCYSGIYHAVLHGNERKQANETFRMLSSHKWSAYVSNPNVVLRQFCKVFSSDVFALSEKTMKRASDFLKKKFIPMLKTVYYINLNFGEQLNADELSKLSGICRTDYFRLFKRLFKCTVYQYIQLVRVTHAIMLCKFSTYSLSYIADICGFCSLSHMDVQVKKHTKTKLPKHYRKERKQNISAYPLMILSREQYETVTTHLHAFGL